MTLDDIIAKLRTAEVLPTDALRAAVSHAAALADPVLSLAQKIQDGVYLLPEEEQLLLYGVHVLAATRNEDLYATLLALTERDEHVLEHIFGDHNIYALTRLLLSTYDDDDATLFERLHHRGTPDDLRWIIFGLVTRLTWDGRIARDGTIAFLRRFAEDPLADDDDMVWHGWEDAVVLLGLEELQLQLEGVWRKAVFRTHREIDRQDARDMLQTAAANPEDEAPLIENGFCPIDDPAEALSWVERMTEHGDTDTDASSDDDPAVSVRLSTDELDWLAGFLTSEQVPDMSMNLEMLDGYFTSLVVGPTTVMPSEYLPEIWGEDSDATIYDSVDQAEHVMGLLMRHWNTIAGCVAADHLLTPILVPYSDAERGRDWAQGFAEGIALRSDDWTPLLSDLHTQTSVPSILALIRDDGELFAERVTPSVRSDILERLPEVVQAIADYWRDPARSRPSREPIRSKKVGRNQPCPCGSGKKYKRCCGSSGPPTLH